MKKDTFYFSHDFNARTDDKIKALIRKHGMTGYGIFWAIIEDLYNNANALRLDCDGIAFDLRTESDTIKSIIEDFGLFVIEDSFFGSLSVQKRLDERQKKENIARENAYKRWKKPENNATALPLQSEPNAIKERKGNKGNEIKESKVNDISIVSTKPKKTVEERIEDFRQDCLSFIGKYPNETLKAFFNHWSELTPDGKKMKKENQKTWQTKNRLVTWFNNESKFNRGYSAPPKQTSGDKTMSVLANFIAKVDNE